MMYASMNDHDNANMFGYAVIHISDTLFLISLSKYIFFIEKNTSIVYFH